MTARPRAHRVGLEIKKWKQRINWIVFQFELELAIESHLVYLESFEAKLEKLNHATELMLIISWLT